MQDLKKRRDSVKQALVINNAKVSRSMRKAGVSVHNMGHVGNVGNVGNMGNVGNVGNMMDSTKLNIGSTTLSIGSSVHNAGSSSMKKKGSMHNTSASFHRVGSRAKGHMLTMHSRLICSPDK